MMCPSTMALAIALVPGVNTEEVQFGQLVTLAIALAITLLGRLALDFV